jgi:two-component system, NarL family, nitrate/nitrite response regulator NarL
MRPIKIMLCEDDAEKRRYLQILLKRHAVFDLVGTFGEGEAAVAAAEELRPEVVLMDLKLPDLSGIEATQRIKAASPETHVVIYTEYEDEEKIYAALLAGASGYLLKKTPPMRLAEAIREVVEGGAPLSPGIARRLLKFLEEQAKRERSASEQRAAADEGFTERQRLIVQRLTEGHSYKQIAEELACSVEALRDMR